MPDTVFDRFDSRKGERPRSEAVLSGVDWPDAHRLGARFVASSGGGMALWFLPGRLQELVPPLAYEGVTLGTEPRLDLRETGFYRPQSFAGVRGRWTNGAATLLVPLDPGHLPRALTIETMAPGREGALLQVLANGVELWQERIPPAAWSKTVGLEGIPLRDELLLELKSDIFSPAESVPGSGDRRRLGVAVTGIRLTARESLTGPAGSSEEADAGRR